MTQLDPKDLGLLTIKVLESAQEGKNGCPSTLYTFKKNPSYAFNFDFHNKEYYEKLFKEDHNNAFMDALHRKLLIENENDTGLGFFKLNEKEEWEFKLIYSMYLQSELSTANEFIKNVCENIYHDKYEFLEGLILIAQMNKKEYDACHNVVRKSEQNKVGKIYSIHLTKAQLIDMFNRYITDNEFRALNNMIAYDILKDNKIKTIMEFFDKYIVCGLSMYTNRKTLLMDDWNSYKVVENI